MSIVFQDHLCSQSLVFLSSNCQGRKSTNYIELVDLCVHTLSWTDFTLSVGLGTLGGQAAVRICTFPHCAFLEKNCYMWMF